MTMGILLSIIIFLVIWNSFIFYMSRVYDNRERLDPMEKMLMAISLIGVVIGVIIIEGLILLGVEI